MAAKIIGHKAQRQFLEQAARSNKLPSTMMFAGASGIGKKLVAAELAATVLCEKFLSDSSSSQYGGCGSCKSCTLVAHGNYPDLMLIDCNAEGSADVDALRELMRTVQMRTFGGASRVIIFNNADALSVQGANLLLKSFEEPRPGNYFILLCSNPSSLPQTLLSRCQIWFFDRLSESEVKEILKLQGASSDFEVITAMADGSLEQVETLRAERQRWEQLRTELLKIAGGDHTTAITTAQRLAKDKESLPLILSLGRTIAREQMRSAISENERSKWAAALQNFLSAERLIFERNLNASAVFGSLLTLLAKPASFTRLTNDDTLLERIVV